MKIAEKFIKFVKFDTMSDENSSSFPSTASQLEFGKILVQELHEMGITNAYQDEFGYIYAKLDGDSSLPRIGLIAHMDTAPSLQGGNFEPRIIKNYDGNPIVLSEKYVTEPSNFPSLKRHIGHDLIVTDGEHLLGGDDKAGIAIIMEILEYYSKNKDVNHASIRVCFTPDEEIGQGALHFDVNKMDADFAYTLDGGAYNDVNFENFNAASAVITIHGVGVHPGSAKNIMVNAITLAHEFNSMLPINEVPEHTSNYEGFYHLTDIHGDVEKTTLSYILRDHDASKLEEKINKIHKIADILNKKHPTAKVIAETKHSYKNMKTYFESDDRAIRVIEKAYKTIGYKPIFSPIRGGTDGATITYMGLPCPNIGVGDYNCHGRYEYVSINEMEMVYNVVKNLLENKELYK